MATLDCHRKFIPPAWMFVLLPTLVLTVGCEKVPTFDELTGQEQVDAEKTTGLNNTTVTQQPPQQVNNLEPAAPPQPSPEEVIAGFRELNPVQITDNELAQLASLEPPYLQEFNELDLRQSKVTDRGLAHLHKLPNLRVLDVSQTEITPEGVATLSRIPTLEDLSLHGMPHRTVATRFANFDAAVPHLAGAASLKSLDLSRSRITPAGLAPIATAVQLERLVLDSVHIGSAGMAYLQGLTNLRELNLRLAQITDQDFVHLKGMSHLQRIHVDGNSINGSGFQVLRDNRLTYINAGETSFATNGFLFIKGSQSLEELHLRQAGVSDLGMQVISGMRNLRVLNVSANPAITDQGVVLLKTLKDLELLALHELPRVTDAGVGALVATRSRKPLLPKLYELNLVGTGCSSRLAQAIDAAWKEAGLQDIRVRAAGGIF